jgi:hypothetical protein
MYAYHFGFYFSLGNARENLQKSPILKITQKKSGGVE